MKTLKKIGLWLLDFVEVWMPTISLTVIFVAFIVNVVSRYIFNSPINACYELCLGGLVWTLFLSAPYAVRTHSNVAFTLLVDRVNPKVQLGLAIIGNLQHRAVLALHKHDPVEAGIQHSYETEEQKSVPYDGQP